ncbi:MAG: hypothetical protein M0P66_01750 [Salinivirgaceae bacterium]|nr:hypothetical protein [Salinivirgaceae bacterium]
MKNFIVILIVASIWNGCQSPTHKTNPEPVLLPDSTGLTNNFYDNEPTIELPMAPLKVDGEIANPGTVDFSVLPLHSVIVKEANLNTDGTNAFVGAYRYDGYSLYDILNSAILKKKNAEEFPPIIDLYVEVSNDNGEKVVFSWGEIYYPNHTHQILIAKSVMRIVPSKTKDLWPLPEISKLVVANDLLTARNISNPTTITVKSLDAIYEAQKGLSPMYCESFKLIAEDGSEKIISGITKEIQPLTYHTIFYGRGRGIHSTTPFTGYMAKQVLAPYFGFTHENIQKGLFVFAGLDGYRVAISYSELFNRNDQSEFLLLIDANDNEGGKFKVFPACDFFSDRAVKSLMEVRLLK